MVCRRLASFPIGTVQSPRHEIYTDAVCPSYVAYFWATIHMHMSADHLRLSVEVNHLIGPPTEAWLEEWCVLMSEMHLLLLRYLKKSTVSSKLLLVG